MHHELRCERGPTPPRRKRRTAEHRPRFAGPANIRVVPIHAPSRRSPRAGVRLPTSRETSLVVTSWRLAHDAPACGKFVVPKFGKGRRFIALEETAPKKTDRATLAPPAPSIGVVVGATQRREPQRGQWPPAPTARHGKDRPGHARRRPLARHTDREQRLGTRIQASSWLPCLRVGTKHCGRLRPVRASAVTATSFGT